MGTLERADRCCGKEERGVCARNWRGRRYLDWKEDDDPPEQWSLAKTSWAAKVVAAKCRTWYRRRSQGFRKLQVAPSIGWIPLIAQCFVFSGAKNPRDPWPSHNIDHGCEDNKYSVETTNKSHVQAFCDALRVLNPE